MQIMAIGQYARRSGSKRYQPVVRSVGRNNTDPAKQSKYKKYGKSAYVPSYLVKKDLNWPTKPL